MNRIILTNKPLVEAIFEVRWKLIEPTPGIKIDQQFKLMLGSIYEKIKEEYPFHEELSTSTMPDLFSGYVVQHRFRKAEGEWPLVQLGPGVMTLNDTTGYTWEDFEHRIKRIIKALFQSRSDLEISNIILRYIDGVEFDFKNNDIFNFLKNKMKIQIELLPLLFDKSKVEVLPVNVDLHFSYRSTKPSGSIELRFFRGKKQNIDSIIWETLVQSSEDKAPMNPEQISLWIKDAHELTNDWFFKLIEGELKRQFL